MPLLPRGAEPRRRETYLFLGCDIYYVHVKS